MNERWRRITTGVLIGTIVAVLCLVFALQHVELWRLRRALEGAHFIFALPTLAAVFLFYRIKATRWSQLLSPSTRVTGNELFPAVIIGYAGNTLVPLQFGDVLRAGIAARRQKLPTAPVLVSIGLERVLDLITLLAPIGIALTVMPHVPPTLRNTTLLFSGMTIAALALFVFYVFWTSRFIAVIEKLCRYAPTRIADVILKQAALGVDGLAALRSVPLLGKVLLTSVVHWSLWVLAVWCSLRALHIDAPPVAALFATVFLVIGTNLPNSPGYVGSIQLAYVLALKPFGVPAEAALAASVFFHLLAYPSIVLVGLAYLRRLRVGWTELRDFLPGPDPGAGR